MGKDVYCSLMCTTRARTVIGFIAWYAMFKNITIFLLVMMALREEIVEGSTGLRFSGRLDPKTGDPSHAEYEPWNWHANTTLQFFFQTSSHEDALIFYQDDGARNDQFMDLFLLNGKARFRARVGQDMEEFEHRVIQRDFADSKWHQVKIEVSEKEIMFSIDDIRPAERTIKFTQNAESALNAPLYIAGIPMEVPTKYSYGRIFKEALFPRHGLDALFEGCIGDVRMNRSPNGRLERARLRKPPIDATESCSGACEERRCYHGRCIDRIRESECDCSGTGYEGDNCETSSKIVLMNVLENGKGYIYQRLENNSPYLSTERNTLDFRFLSLVKDGVIFYMGKDEDHLLVELVNGSIRVQADFGGGPVVVQLGTNALSDSCWYYTVIRRKKTQLTVILKNDRGEEIGRETRNSSASFATLNLNNQSNVIYYGGGPSQVLRLAQAKQLFFKGYFQQFRFEEFNVIDSALSDKNGFSITDKDRVFQARFTNMLLQTAEDQCRDKGPSRSPDSSKPSTTPSESTTRSTTSSSMPTTPRRNPPKPETQRSAEQKAPPTPRAKGVSTWVIISIVLAAMALVFVSVFLLYRWNHRYTGSFKPNKNTVGQPQEPEAERQQQGTRVYNQPAFLVYKPAKKPPTAQSPPVSI